MRVDLDAARAARAEARGEAPSVVVNGREFKLVPELPLMFAEALRENRMWEAQQLMLLNKDELEDFLACELTSDDLEAIAEAYSAGTVGESRASRRSSTNGGRPSRPTSNASTT